MKNIYKVLFSQRTFSSDIPKYIKKNISEEILKKIEKKDVNITVYIEIEEL